jgi:hypothetical protein
VKLREEKSRVAKCMKRSVKKKLGETTECKRRKKIKRRRSRRQSKIRIN